MLGRQVRPWCKSDPKWGREKIVKKDGWVVPCRLLLNQWKVQWLLVCPWAKESACNAGNPGSIPRSGRSAGEEMGYPLQYSWPSLVVQVVKNPPTMRVPGLGGSPGKGNSYPLQYSGLENSMDCIVHGVTKSRTRLSDFSFHLSQFGWQYVALPSFLSLLFF